MIQTKIFVIKVLSSPFFFQQLMIKIWFINNDELFIVLKSVNLMYRFIYLDRK